MAKKVTIGKVEHESIARLHEYASNMGCADKKALAAVARVLAKLDKPEVRRDGLTISDAEVALAGCQKYVRYVGGNPFALVSTMARQGVNQEQLAAVARWIDRQSWLRGGVALGTILRNWPNWLAQAVNDEGRVRGTWQARWEDRTAGLIEGQDLPEEGGE